MKRGMAISLALLVALGLAIAAYVFLKAGPEVANDGPGQSAIAIRPSDDQADAIRQARQTDLPALDGATRVVIESDPPAQVAPVERSGPADIAAIRSALALREIPPSGGMRAYRLRFFRGETPIRAVWVYGSGEWGFERPGQASWTLGSNPELVRTIRALIEGNTPPKS